MDGNKIFEDKKIMLLVINNGKYMGGGLIGSPYSIINDGLAELIINHDYIWKGA